MKLPAPCAFATIAALIAPNSAATDPLVVVDGGPPPKVVASFPADGGIAPAGVLVLKLVFSQVMDADGWSYARSADGAFPDCLGQPRMLGDQRTFVLLCTVAPHQRYAVQINATRSFAADHGRSARPTLLHFSTGEAGVFDMHAALKQAGLSDADEPIMRWRDTDAGHPALASPPREDDDAGAPAPARTAASVP